MPKKASPNAPIAAIEEQFLKRVQELWAKHENEFSQILDEAETKKINLTFKATLDFSETAARLTTNISFSQVVKDGREDTFDDENQLQLPGAEPEQAEEPAAKGKPAAKKGGKKSKDFVPPTE